MKWIYHADEYNLDCHILQVRDAMVGGDGV